MERGYEWIVVKPVNANRENIKRLVCEEFGITEAGLRSKVRKRNLVDARMVFANLTRKHLNDTIMCIAIELNTHYSQVIRYQKQLEDLISVNDAVGHAVARIEKQLLNPINK